jgi:hypothetical protein
MERPLFRQAPGDAQAIDAVHPIEALGYCPGLVGLNTPDEVPAQGLAREAIHFGQSFLKIVFAEIRDAGGGGQAYGFGSLGLGNGDQGDRWPGPVPQPWPLDVSET